MGFSITWTAVRAPMKAVLDEFGLEDTGEADPANEQPISGAAIAGGWYVVWFSESMHRLAHGSVASLLSLVGETISCTVDEHSMTSKAVGFESGELRWLVAHDASRGARHLEVQGTPPGKLDLLVAQVTARSGGRN